MPFSTGGGSSNITGTNITDGSIADADIADNAAISLSKINLTSKSGTSAGPSASGTQQITHGLGRTPKIIRIYGVGNFNTGEACDSKGVYNSSGNHCIYISSSQGSNRSPAADNSNCIALSTGNTPTVATGLINNVGATTFDIVWTAAGDVSATTYFLWEAE